MRCEDCENGEWEVAKHLDVLFDRLLASGAESAQIHWEEPQAA